MSSADGACDCCVGVGDLTPVHLDVRPGLSAIAYRVGTHPEFLASMIAGLTDADRPRLADLAARDSDDFTIALLDAWAVVADVLTFYSERARTGVLPANGTRSRLAAGAGPAHRLPDASRGRPPRHSSRSRSRRRRTSRWPHVAGPRLGAAGDAGDRHARARAARPEHPRPGRAAADVRDRRGGRRSAGVERDGGVDDDRRTSGQQRDDGMATWCCAEPQARRRRALRRGYPGAHTRPLGSPLLDARRTGSRVRPHEDHVARPGVWLQAGDLAGDPRSAALRHAQAQ